MWQQNYQFDVKCSLCSRQHSLLKCCLLLCRSEHNCRDAADRAASNVADGGIVICGVALGTMNAPHGSRPKLYHDLFAICLV